MIAVAFTMADRSTCSRRHNGAVIADPRGVVLSTGYNGSLAGMDHCDHECSCTGLIDPPSHKDWCRTKVTTCPTAVHAEANAVYFAARNGVRVEGAVIYCTTEPCRKCAEAIVQSGISECVYAQEYRVHDGLDLLKSAGISIGHLPNSM